jgi:hypothetical protein
LGLRPELKIFVRAPRRVWSSPIILPAGGTPPALEAFNTFIRTPQIKRSEQERRTGQAAPQLPAHNSKHLLVSILAAR